MGRIKYGLGEMKYKSLFSMLGVDEPQKYIYIRKGMRYQSRYEGERGDAKIHIEGGGPRSDTGKKIIVEACIEFNVSPKPSV